MNILLVSYAYPPISSPGAMRVAHFAKDLTEFGYNVTVLTSENGYSSMVSNNVPSYFFDGINVIRATDLLNKKQAGKSLRNINGSSFKSKIKSKLVKLANSLIFPDRDITWYLPAKNHYDLKEKAFDIVMGSYPSTTNLLLANTLAKQFNAKLVLDMRDLWVEDHNFIGKGWLRKFFESRLERKLNGNANLVTSVSSFNSGILANKLSCNVETIYNGYDQELFSTIPKPLDDQSKFNLAYAGSFYNGERDPKPLLNALSRLKNESIINTDNFTFSIYGNQEVFLELLTDDLGMSDLVSFEGIKEQHELLEELTNASMLLTITRKQKISKGEMTTKLFEYLALKRPCLCLTKLDFEIAKTLSEIEHALVIDVDDEQSIYTHLKEHIKRWKLAGVENVDFCPVPFSRRAASERLKECLENL